MDNVHSLPFNAQTPDQMLIQIGHDFGEDLESAVIVLKRKSTGQHYVCFASPSENQIGFLATACLMLHNFSIQGLMGVFGEAPRKGEK